MHVHLPWVESIHNLKLMHPSQHLPPHVDTSELIENQSGVNDS